MFPSDTCLILFSSGASFLTNLTSLLTYWLLPRILSKRTFVSFHYLLLRNPEILQLIHVQFKENIHSEDFFELIIIIIIKHSRA